MRYASIRELDVSNGLGVGIALFVQGCHRHCFNCFNPDTWDFNGGKEWKEEDFNKLINLLSRPYITRITFLGGEPLAKENIEEIYKIIKYIKENYPNKKIWLYTGETINEKYFIEESNNLLIKTVKECDIVIDGPYINELRDLRLKFRGSSNQRIIDIKESLKQKKIILLD